MNPKAYNLFDKRLIHKENKLWVYCPIRKSELLCTPEEGVRQQFIDYLIVTKKYPKNFMQSELSLKVGKLNKRADILVSSSKFAPFLVVECKAPNVELSQAVLDQAARYNLAFNCHYLVITNGKDTFCFQRKNAESVFVAAKVIPEWE